MTELILKYQPRKYQQHWIKDVWRSWSSGKRRVLAQLATGGGKTICFAHIGNSFFKHELQVLVVAHRIELITQAAEKLEQIVGEPVGIIKAGILAHPERKIQVASIQTLARRELQQLPANIGLLIFDEAHHATASSYRRLIEHYKNTPILGVTATPQRIDGQGFQDLFDDLVIGVPTAELMRQGYLSKFRLFVTDQTLSTKGVSTSRGDFKAKELALAVTSQIGLSSILQNYLKYAKSLRTVIFASSLEHSRAIAQEFCCHGIRAEHLDGDTKPGVRVQILERFQSGITQVISNYEILTEGYDCPDIECVYCLRPTESPTLWLQMTGRSLRNKSNQSTALIIDVTDNWKKHGLPDERREWRLEPIQNVAIQSRGTIKCKNCTHIFKPLSHELVALYGEIDSDGLVIMHHEAVCPNCTKTVEFTTRENKHRPSRIQLRDSINLELTEINLEVSELRIRQVYDLIRREGLKNSPAAKIYKAVFMNFIEKITEFTLGEWREIVKIASPNESVMTLKAWELYQESLVRHKNRIAALAFVEQRQGQKQVDSVATKVDDQPKKTLLPPTASVQRQKQKSFALTPKLGNPYFQEKYALEWKKSLTFCSITTADFLNESTGLFHVEVTAKFVRISLEVVNSPGLKSKLKELYKEIEIQSAFSQGFGKEAKVMLRLT